MSLQVVFTLRFCSFLITSEVVGLLLEVRKMHCFSMHPLSATNSGELWRGRIAENGPGRETDRVSFKTAVMWREK